MRYKIYLFVLCCLFILPVQGKNDTRLKYDIECAGGGVQGTYLVQVSVYVGKKDINPEMILKAATHGVIFRGFSGTAGCFSQKAMAKNPALEEQQAEFFHSFFDDNGAYRGYTKVIEGTFQTARTSNKKEYKITATVAVQKDQLRKDLEEAGVLQALSDGF